MTLEEVKAIDREFLTPAQVASVLGCDPHGIRVWARECPNELGFPVVVIKHRVKVPRRAFVRFMEGRDKD